MKEMDLKAFGGGKQAINRVFYMYYFFNCHCLFYFLNCHSIFYYHNCHLCILLPLLSFSFSMYVHRELVHKGAVLPAFAPAYFDTYFDPDDKDFIFTKL